MVSEEVLKILFSFVKREWPYCYCYCVNFIFTLREPNVYKPHGFFLGFLATFICFCVTVLFYRYLYFVVNQIKLQSYKVTKNHKPIFVDKKVIICALRFIQFVVYSMRNSIVYRTAKKVVFC